MAKYRLLRTDIIPKKLISLDTDENDEGAVLFFALNCIVCIEIIKELIPKAIELRIIEEVPKAPPEPELREWTDEDVADIVYECRDIEDLTGDEFLNILKNIKKEKGIK